MEETTPNQVRADTVKPHSSGSNQFPNLLTVGQACQYLHSKGLERTTKTIRKWCRLQHVDTKSNTIPGGPKWLILRTSLDAKIEEEKVIEAALRQRTGSDQFEPVHIQTSSNPSEPVHNEQLISTLAQQIIEKDKQLENAHLRQMELTQIIASQNNQHHQLARDMAQLGMTIGNALRLGSGDSSNRSAPERSEEVTARVVEKQPHPTGPAPWNESPSQHEERTSENPSEPAPPNYNDERYEDQTEQSPRMIDEHPKQPNNDRGAPNDHVGEDVEYPPRYGTQESERQGDNNILTDHIQGVQYRV